MTQWCKLPDEITDCIIIYACTTAPLDVNEGADPLAIPARGGMRDVKTNLNLMLVNSACYATAAPLLYVAIALSTPARLAQFAQTLLWRPELGDLVEHLFVGPKAHVPSMPESVLLTGASSTEEAYSLLRDEDRLTAPSEAPPTILPHALELEIVERCALLAGASRMSSGIDIARPGFDAQQRRITLDEWVLRLSDGRGLLSWLRAMAARASSQPWGVPAGRATDRAQFLETLRDSSAEAVDTLAVSLGVYATLYRSSNAQTDASPDLPAALLRRTGTRNDPLDFDSASQNFQPLPAPLEETFPELPALQLQVLREWDAASGQSAAIPAWIRALCTAAIAFGRLDALVQNRTEEQNFGDCTALEGAAHFCGGDQFDDPCVYARSRAIHLMLGNDDASMQRPPAGAAHHDSEREPWMRRNISRKDSLLSTFERRPFGVQLSTFTVPLQHFSAPPNSPAWRKFPEVRAADIASTISSLHCVLGSTPNIVTLSVSGVLERVLAGRRSSVQLRKLYVFRVNTQTRSLQNNALTRSTTPFLGCTPDVRRCRASDLQQDRAPAHRRVHVAASRGPGNSREEWRTTEPALCDVDDVAAHGVAILGIEPHMYAARYRSQLAGGQRARGARQRRKIPSNPAFCRRRARGTAAPAKGGTRVAECPCGAG